MHCLFATAPESYSDMKCQERYVAAPSSLTIGSSITDIRCEPMQPGLVEFLQVSRTWDFELAQTMALKLDARDPITAFEIMRMHELRGSILDALNVAKPFSEGIVHLDSGMSSLFSIAIAYFNCFHSGLWAHGLRAATICCTKDLLHTTLASAPKMKVSNSIQTASIGTEIELT
jgi:hypothetical protein